MLLHDVIRIRTTPAAILSFFDEMEDHYLRWHPQDHKLFRWEQGRGVREGNAFYFEEVINGKLLKKRVVFTRVEPERSIEFVPTFWLMRLFLPRMAFRWEPATDGQWDFHAEIHLRMGPLAAWVNRKDLAAVRTHMRQEGENLKQILETAPTVIPVPAAVPPVPG